jgi:hypothetical protein
MIELFDLRICNNRDFPLGSTLRFRQRHQNQWNTFELNNLRYTLKLWEGNTAWSMESSLVKLSN